MKRLIVLFLTKGSEKVRNISVGVNYFEDFFFLGFANDTIEMTFHETLIKHAFLHKHTFLLSFLFCSTVI